MLKIGYIKNGYPEVRTIIKKIDSVEYIYTRCFLKIILSKIEKLIFKNNFMFEPFIINKKSNPKISGYHFFNHILNGSDNFITTYETFLPRILELNTIHHFGNTLQIEKDRKKIGDKINILAKKNCKKLISLSKCNYDLQVELLNQYPLVKNIIISKMIHLHPPQKLLINEKRKKMNFQKIRFIFVGGDFIRKGGAEIVEAFNNVSNYVENIELILITNLELSYNYVFKDFQDNREYLNNLKKLIESNKKIIHYTKLENSKVIKLMKESHVGLLPTWGDTYGYSVLEYQAAGCPVITTNVRALTEINNNECGWIINLPLNKYKELGIDSELTKEKLREEITKKLEWLFYDISNNKNQLIDKSKRCIERIKKYHDPEEYGNKLKKIYEESFKNI